LSNNKIEVPYTSIEYPQPLQNISEIGVLPENLPALDVSNDHVIQRPGPI